MAGEDDFLSRWSRRKRAVREAEEQEERSTSEAEPRTAALPPSDIAEQPDEGTVAVTEPELPVPTEEDVAALTKDSDFTQYLKDHVPKHIRRMALRKLWTSDPLLANLDGLNDYDEDFSQLGMVASKVSTSYRVGRGFGTEEEDAAGVAKSGKAEAPAAPEPDEVASEVASEAESGEVPDSDGDGQAVAEGEGANGGDSGDSIDSTDSTDGEAKARG